MIYNVKEQICFCTKFMIKPYTLFVTAVLPNVDLHASKSLHYISLII